jgi:hypothetical protein
VQVKFACYGYSRKKYTKFTTAEMTHTFAVKWSVNPLGGRSTEIFVNGALNQRHIPGNGQLLKIQGKPLVYWVETL